MQEYVHFFLQLFCRYSHLFFSPGRDQLLGREGQKNIGPDISPHISPLNDFWVAGCTALSLPSFLLWSIRLGQNSSTGIKGDASTSV